MELKRKIIEKKNYYAIKKTCKSLVQSKSAHKMKMKMRKRTEKFTKRHIK